MAGESGITTRRATQADAGAIARIYNQGIEERIATFETRPRTAGDVASWFDGVHPIVVVEDGGQVVGFASTSSYRPRECYAKIAEFSVYVARDHRGRGLGRRALLALIDESGTAGRHKLVSRIFPENVASRAACCGIGSRSGSRSGQRPSVADYVKGTATKAGATAAGCRSCCLL